jgi:hypothetical protein
MVGACITTANTTENKAVWNGNPPLDFTTDIAQLSTDYGSVTAKAALSMLTAKKCVRRTT